MSVNKNVPVSVAFFSLLRDGCAFLCICWILAAMSIYFHYQMPGWGVGKERHMLPASWLYCLDVTGLSGWFSWPTLMTSKLKHMAEIGGSEMCNVLKVLPYSFIKQLKISAGGQTSDYLTEFISFCSWEQYDIRTKMFYCWYKSKSLVLCIKPHFYIH